MAWLLPPWLLLLLLPWETASSHPTCAIDPMVATADVPLTTAAHPQLLLKLQQTLATLYHIDRSTINSSLVVTGTELHCTLGAASSASAAAEVCAQRQLPQHLWRSATDKLALKLQQAKLSQLQQLTQLRSKGAHLLLTADVAGFYSSRSQQLRPQLAWNLTFTNPNSNSNSSGLDMVRASQCQQQLDAGKVQQQHFIEQPRVPRELQRRFGTSFEQFWRSWELGKPFLAADMHKTMLPQTKGRLSLQQIDKMCGTVRVVPQQWSARHAGWAGLIDAPPSSLRSFIRSINSTREASTYVHDVGLPVECPQLLEGAVCVQRCIQQ